MKTLYHDSLMQPLCVSATHIYLQQCKLEFDEHMLACTVAEISVAQALLMKAFFLNVKNLCEIVESDFENFDICHSSQTL